MTQEKKLLHIFWSTKIKLEALNQCNFLKNVRPQNLNNFQQNVNITISIFMLRTKLLHASGQNEKKFISNFAYLCGFILHIFKQLFSLKLANYKISKKFGKNYKRKCCMFQGKQKHNKNTAFIVLYCIKGIS